MNITFRPATIDNAPFVATVMMEAVEIPMMEEKRTPEPHLIDICRRTDTLYSYKNAIIIEDGERPIAGLISYEGAGYHEVKMRTFGMVKDKLPFDFETMDDETREGEYYLDSLAVLPEYRGRGIGRRAIEHGVSIARERGLLPILACDPDNTNAYNLYKKIGFHEDGKLFIFGETYLRMVFD